MADFDKSLDEIFAKAKEDLVEENRLKQSQLAEGERKKANEEDMSKAARLAARKFCDEAIAPLVRSVAKRQGVEAHGESTIDDFWWWCFIGQTRLEVCITAVAGVGSSSSNIHFTPFVALSVRTVDAHRKRAELAKELLVGDELGTKGRGWLEEQLKSALPQLLRTA